MDTSSGDVPQDNVCWCSQPSFHNQDASKNRIIYIKPDCIFKNIASPSSIIVVFDGVIFRARCRIHSFSQNKNSEPSLASATDTATNIKKVYNMNIDPFKHIGLSGMGSHIQHVHKK